jgi:hypothetical protein
MQVSRLGSTVIATALLAGCGEPTVERSPPVHHGRYTGIGIYPAGPLWSQISVPATKRNAAAANAQDDSQVIVVVDSLTGEIRQCGDVSGYCIGMNPWTRKLAATQAAPVTLAKHAADLQRETEESAVAK